MSEDLTPEMIDAAEANIRADYRSGKISKEQFQKELLIVANARRQALPSRNTGSQMKKPRLTMFHRISIGLAFVVFAAFILFSCARPQPMGEDLYLGLRHMDQQRK